MSQLIRHFRPVFVIHHKLTSATDTEFLKYRLSLQFHYIITVVFRRILYLYFYGRRVLILHATIPITHTFASRQQPSPRTERCLRPGIHLTGRVGLLANGLHITDAAIGLKRRRNQIIPSSLNHRSIPGLVQQTMVYAPHQAVGKECRTARLRSRSILFAQHTAAPISFRPLAACHTLRQLPEPFQKESAVLIVLRHVAQHLGQTCQHPSVATRPETLSATGSLHFGIDVFRVTVIQLRLRIIHQAVAPQVIFIHAVQEHAVARQLIHLRHQRHHHVERIRPPPELVLIQMTGVRHYLLSTGYLIIGRIQIIHVDVGLETNLPVAEQHEILPLAIRLVLPVPFVVAVCAPPTVMLAPLLTVFIISSLPSQPVSFHVSGVISGVVPKSTRLGRIVRLPIVIYFLYQPQDVSRPRAALSCRRKKHTCTPQDHPHAQKLEIKVFHVD